MQFEIGKLRSGDLFQFPGGDAFGLVLQEKQHVPEINEWRVRVMIFLYEGNINIYYVPEHWLVKLLRKHDGN